jgi:Flp pilus assembly protein TadG
MITQIKTTLSRAGASAVEDALGVVSLFVLLFAALSFSGVA